MEKCKLCPLHACTPMQCQGRTLNNKQGGYKRKIMIVTDSPHDNDYFTRTFFADSRFSGEFFKLITTAKLNPDDIYLTGLVKCTPKIEGVMKEVILKRQYIDACNIYLQTELAQVQPEYIILFGEKVFSFFHPDLLFTDNRGKLMDCPRFHAKTFATYNPVSMAFTNKFDQIIYADMRKVSNIIYNRTEEQTVAQKKSGKDYRFPLKSLDILRALNKKLKEVETFAFDIETHGQGLFKYKLLSIGFSYKKDTGVSVPVWVKDKEKEEALNKVVNYVIPKRTKKVVSGMLKSGEPRYKTVAVTGTQQEDRDAIKAILPSEYKYIADMETVGEMKRVIRGILDKEPPLKKYWGDQHDECMALIKEIMENDTPKGAHNGSYDVNRLRGIGINVKNYAWDTILMHHLLDEERPHGLDDLSYVYTKDGGYKSEKNKYLNSSKTSWANIPMEELLPYNAQDADVTLQLYYVFLEKLQKEPKLLNLFYKQTMPAQRMLIDMSFRGSDVDMNWLNKTQQEYRKRMNDLKCDFSVLVNRVMPNVYVVEDAIEAEEFKRQFEEEHKDDAVKPKMPAIFNMNSNKQLVELFRDYYHITMKKKTATGDALDAKVLKKLSKSYPAAKILLEYKALYKLDSTYLTGVKESIDADNKIHTEFLLYGTVTGRLSSRNINCQNQPKETKFMFIPPKGYVCVNVDQSAAELHVLAWMANDRKMMQIFEDRRDLHRETAAGVFGKKPEEITDEERKIAKRVSFGTAYSISGPGLAEILEPEGVKITGNQGDKYIKKWRETYKSCAKFLDNSKKWFTNYRRLQNPFGRIRHKYKQFADNSKEATSQRQACNFPIQSTASDIQIYEMVQMYPTLIENGVLPVFTVHDSIVMYCPYDKLEWLRDYYKQCTCRRFNDDEFNGLHGCLMYTEMEVGRNYGEHVKLPYDCDFAEWKKQNEFLFDNPA